MRNETELKYLNESKPPQLSDPSHLTVLTNNIPSKFVIITTPLFLCGLITNLLAIATLAKCRRLVKSVRFFTWNLALADTLLCLTYPLSLLYAYIPCSYAVPFLVAFFISSIVFTACLSLDRCLALKFALRYITWCSGIKINVVCICVWVLSFSIGFFATSGMKFKILKFLNEGNCLQYYLTNRMFTWCIFVFHFMAIALVTLAFVVIIKEIKRLDRVVFTTRQTARRRLTMNTDSKMTRTVFIIVSMFLFTNTLILLFYAVSISQFPNMDVYSNLYYITAILRLVDSLANPFIYVWRLTECRVRVLLLFCSCNERLRNIAIKLHTRSVLGFDLREVDVGNTLRNATPMAPGTSKSDNTDVTSGTIKAETSFMSLDSGVPTPSTSTYIQNGRINGLSLDIGTIHADKSYMNLDSGVPKASSTSTREVI